MNLPKVTDVHFGRALARINAHTQGSKSKGEGYMKMVQLFMVEQPGLAKLVMDQLAHKRKVHPMTIACSLYFAIVEAVADIEMKLKPSVN